MKHFSYLFIIWAGILWWIEAILILPNLYSLPVPLVVWIQTTLLTLMLTPFFYKHFAAYKNMSSQQWLIILCIALLWWVIGIIAITKALFYVNYVNLSIVVLIQKLQPLFAIWLASIFLKEKLHSHFLLWSWLALIWTYIMTFWLSLPNMNTGWHLIIASGLALLAAISFGSTTVLTRKFLHSVSPLDWSYLRIVLSTLILSIIILNNWEYQAIWSITPQQLWYFWAIAITWWVWIYFYNLWLRSTKASIGTLCELSFPLTAILLEFFIRGNILTLTQFSWVMLLMISVMMIVREKK